MIGVLGFLPTHAETNANKMRPQSLRAMQHFMPVCLHALTAVHRITVTLIMGKAEYPQMEPHAWIKMAQVLGSLVYICSTDRDFSHK